MLLPILLPLRPPILQQKIKHTIQEQEPIFRQKQYTSSSSESSDCDEDIIDRGWWIGEKPVITRKKKHTLVVAQIPDRKENDATAGMEDTEMQDVDDDETEDEEDKEMRHTENEIEGDEETESRDELVEPPRAEPEEVHQVEVESELNPEENDEDEEAKEIREMLNDLFSGRNGKRFRYPLMSKRVRNLIKGHPYKKHFERLIHLYYSNPDTNPNYIR
ncbi:hypothetical protein TWF506_001638 [Arthrobotrys conoides]|uniref:Uncharacterized protein n=1 Tax=Arthrobotrys conoides TaxID=74498 RepID=A0AAN8NXY1_9PEZI